MYEKKIQRKQQKKETPNSKASRLVGRKTVSNKTVWRPVTFHFSLFFVSNQSVGLCYTFCSDEKLLMTIKCYVIRILLLKSRDSAYCVCISQSCYHAAQSCYQFSVVLLALWKSFSYIKWVALLSFCFSAFYQWQHSHRKLFVQILQYSIFTFSI